RLLCSRAARTPIGPAQPPVAPSADAPDPIRWASPKSRAPASATRAAAVRLARPAVDCRAHRLINQRRVEQWSKVMLGTLPVRRPLLSIGGSWRGPLDECNHTSDPVEARSDPVEARREGFRGGGRR